MVVVLASSILAPGAAHADWRSWLFGPKDYEECAVNAAKEAKSKDALAILLSSCELQFRGRRKPTEGYTLYDNRQNRYFDIKGPNPTPAEVEYIDRQYSAYISAQAEYERLQQEEAERRAAIRRSEAERQRVETERQRFEAQIAKAEFQKRQQIALPEDSSNVRKHRVPLRDDLRQIQANHRNNKSIAREDFRSFGRLGFPTLRRRVPDLCSD
jgi:hypothetical protein